MRKLLFISLLLSVSIGANAQKHQKHKISQSDPHINHSQNKIICGNIDPFYKKLLQLEKTGKGVVSVVQIGDSHTQPDFISSIVRDELQQKFGNAGRGMVFPYQLAKSNAPKDIVSSSTIEWKFNRLTHPEIDTNSGISGFVLESNFPEGDLMLSVKEKGTVPQTFSKMKLFFKSDSTVKCTVIAGSDSISGDVSQPITLSSPASSFKLYYTGNTSSYEFYGASIESGKSGVLYHNIGVNGARYDHYNLTQNFWEQLPQLHADLYIVSLGTNEAQKDSIDLVKFDSIVNVFVLKLQESAPGATLLITTAADSFKGEESNVVLKNLNSYLHEYCEENKIALWDLYKITNGYGSSKKWLEKGLMNKDRIHYLVDGYSIHGNLLQDCLMNGYQKYKKHKLKTANK